MLKSTCFLLCPFQNQTVHAFSVLMYNFQIKNKYRSFIGKSFQIIWIIILNISFRLFLDSSHMYTGQIVAFNRSILVIFFIFCVMFKERITYNRHWKYLPLTTINRRITLLFKTLILITRTKQTYLNYSDYLPKQHGILLIK